MMEMKANPSIGAGEGDGAEAKVEDVGKGVGVAEVERLNLNPQKRDRLQLRRGMTGQRMRVEGRSVRQMLRRTWCMSRAFTSSFFENRLNMLNHVKPLRTSGGPKP